jgi:tape measure domain-containing protein
MAVRESKLVFSAPGADSAKMRVVSLTEALETQKRRSDELSVTLARQKVGVDLFGAVSQSATAKVTSLTNSIGPLGAGLGALSRGIDPGVNGLLKWASAAEKVSLTNRLMNTAFIGGTTAMIAGSIALGAMIDDAIRAGDTYSTLHARIRTFSDGLIATAENERAIYAASKESRVAVADLTTLYTRLSPAVKDYGRSQQDALTITQLTSKALAIQGADVREQAAATVQFSQAIASGVLRGDELRSLLESSPQLLRYVAQNLEINGKVGVAFSQLRKLGEAGTLTTDKLISALLKAQPAIERDFINAPKTAQQGWVVLKDQVTRTVGTIDQTIGGQRAVVEWLGKMADGAEKWRQKMLLDPASFNGLKAAGDFIGDAVASIGTLGKVAAENFDTIVTAGEGVIALKLGSVMASWFAAAAQGAKNAYVDLKGFQDAARFQAGATQNPVMAQAATAARAAATAADVAATEKAAAAEMAQARALGVRSAADKAQAVTEAARRTEANAQGRAQAALAKVERDAGKDIATAQRLKGEAAEIRARLEEDANRRIAASAKAADAATDAKGLSKAGIGTAGSYYGKLAQEDARTAAMLTDQQRQQQLARLREIEVAEARAAATIEASEHRKAAAVVAADAEIASASNAVIARQAAEAESAALVAAAERSETQAKGANVAATNAAAGAALRNTVAQETEALVTKDVTTAMLIKQGAMKVGVGLYNLLGGAVGVATLAIGGLIWAVMEANRAEKEHYDAIRATVDVTDRLRASTQELTAATWAEVPGILAAAKALREKAAAAEADNRATLRGKQARLEEVRGQMKAPGSPEAAQGLIYEAASLEKAITKLGGALGNENLNAATRAQAAYREQIIAAAKEKSYAQTQLDRGTDASGRTLSAEQKSSLTQLVNGKQAWLQTQVDKIQVDMAVVDRKLALTDVKRPRGQSTAEDKQGLAALSKSLGEIFNYASEGAQPSRTGKPTTPTTKPKKVAVPGGVSEAYTDLLKAGFLQLKGGEGYAADDGKVSLNGKNVTARSADEATALANYVKVVESLNDATDKQLAKKAEQLGVSVKTRAELKLAAGAVLAEEMANSKAAQADEKWADIKAEMTGTTRTQIKAENDLQRLIKDGLEPKQEDIDAYKAWIKAREAASKLAERLQLANPVVQRGFDTALSGSVTPVDSRGVVDEAAAIKRVMAARAAVMLDEDRAVREAIDRLKRTGEVNDVNAAQKAADLKAGYAVALEIQTQDQILEIRRGYLQENTQAAEQQAAESADAIVGALKDATFGGDYHDVGKRIGGDIMSAIYDEILGNPLRLLIKSAISGLMTPGSGVGLFGGLVNAGLGMVGHANLSTTIATSIAKNPNLFADGRVPGYANGRLNGRMDGHIFRGRGGPRGDENMVRISDKEAIINAQSTARYPGPLDAINKGVFEEYIYGRRHADGFVPQAPRVNLPSSAISRREGDVYLVNQTGVDARATKRTDERGNTHIDLKPLADQMARSAGQSGALKRGLQQSPQTKTRA